MGMVVERAGKGMWLPPWNRYQHDARYHWAAERVQGCTVLDAACGTGYGAKRLMEHGACSVSGFDLSAEAIEEARSLNNWPGVTFDVGDVDHLPVPSSSIDLYLSFETIEHLADDDAYLSEARRVLKTDGCLICSTPNRNLTNPGTTINDKPYNPFHLREYSRDELNECLRPHFSQVEFFGQSLYSSAYASLLCRIARIHPRPAVRVHQVCKTLGIPWENAKRHWPVPLQDISGEPEIWIAVCHG